jgi:hypothetical protein
MSSTESSSESSALSRDQRIAETRARILEKIKSLPPIPFNYGEGGLFLCEGCGIEFLYCMYSNIRDEKECAACRSVRHLRHFQRRLEEDQLNQESRERIQRLSTYASQRLCQESFCLRCPSYAKCLTVDIA